MILGHGLRINKNRKVEEQRMNESERKVKQVYRQYGNTFKCTQMRVTSLLIAILLLQKCTYYYFAINIILLYVILINIDINQ